MAEPYGIKLLSAGNFNGTTPIALTRADSSPVNGGA